MNVSCRERFFPQFVEHTYLVPRTEFVNILIRLKLLNGSHHSCIIAFLVISMYVLCIMCNPNRQILKTLADHQHNKHIVATMCSYVKIQSSEISYVSCSVPYFRTNLHFMNFLQFCATKDHFYKLPIEINLDFSRCKKSNFLKINKSSHDIIFHRSRNSYQAPFETDVSMDAFLKYLHKTPLSIIIRQVFKLQISNESDNFNTKSNVLGWFRAWIRKQRPTV